MMNTRIPEKHEPWYVRDIFVVCNFNEEPFESDGRVLDQGLPVGTDQWIDSHHQSRQTRHCFVFSVERENTLRMRVQYVLWGRVRTE